MPACASLPGNPTKRAPRTWSAVLLSCVFKRGTREKSRPGIRGTCLRPLVTTVRSRHLDLVDGEFKRTRARVLWLSKALYDTYAREPRTLSLQPLCLQPTSNPSNRSRNPRYSRGAHSRKLSNGMPMKIGRTTKPPHRLGLSASSSLSTWRRKKESGFSRAAGSAAKTVFFLFKNRIQTSDISRIAPPQRAPGGGPRAR